MPLDTSTYNLGLLRVDGRRWNELRRIRAQIRTQAAADGSSYLEMGHTKVMCVVTGPVDHSQLSHDRWGGGAEAAGGGGGGAAGPGGEGGGAGGPAAGEEAECATVAASIVIAGFSSVDRKRRGRNDRRVAELESVIANTFAAAVHAHLYPHSIIAISLYVLSQDGSLLAALLNATTLALVDAGIPMSNYVAACTTGSTSAHATADEAADPILDLNGQEETELPHATVATLGGGDKVAAFLCESRIQIERLEGLLAVGVDGCREVRAVLDGIVKDKGARMVGRGVLDRGDDVDMEGVEEA